MISERTFARSFTNFWTELLPLLTPNFVHIINNGYKVLLTNKFGEPIEPIEKNEKVRKPAVIAEFAFYIAQLSILERTEIHDVIKEKIYIEKAEQYAYKEVKRYEGANFDFSLPFIKEEIEEGLDIALNYERFFEVKNGKQNIEFGPKIKGAGFLSECKADISIGNTLYEVKTVDRNIAGKDIRQLIIYLALQNNTGNRRWKYAGFFNPRQSIYHEFNVDEIINRMSGGKSSLEVFQDLIDFVSLRDIQIDSSF